MGVGGHGHDMQATRAHIPAHFNLLECDVALHLKRLALLLHLGFNLTILVLIRVALFEQLDLLVDARERLALPIGGLEVAQVAL